MNESIVVHLDIDNLTDSLHDLDFHFDFDRKKWKEHVDDWKQHLEESLGEVRESYQQAM
ncbi:MAG: hypothetical protein IH848_04420, partial [Acidobacteria bacterium]|nr:hypothetical protein [Acidobacteriota bacterium]